MFQDEHPFRNDAGKQKSRRSVEHQLCARAGQGYMVAPSLSEVVGKNIGVAPWHEKSHPNRWLDSMVQFLGRGKFSDVAGASL